MKLPDGRTTILFHGIVTEPTTVDGRLILWVLGERRDGYQQWERITNVAHATITDDQGFRATAATSVRVRQRLGNLLAKLLWRLIQPRAVRVWILPNGEPVEQWGDRQTDLVFAWAEDEAIPLDEARIRWRWPEIRGVRPLGENLYLVLGVKSERPIAAVSSGPEPVLEESSRELAERALGLVRESGDDRLVVTALVDLGLACLKVRDDVRAVYELTEALNGARRLGIALEADVMSGLGLALIFLGKPGQARDALVPSLTSARTAGDRHLEKVIYDRLGLANAALGDHVGALDYFERARAIAVDLEDRQHEADLFWLAGIEQAELGRPDRAVEYGQAAIDILRRLKKPQAEWYAHHLAEYRSGEQGVPLALSVHPSAQMASGFRGTVSTRAAHAVSTGTVETTSRAKLLRMARTATESMAEFVGSGFKTTSTDVYHDRLNVCLTCEHHTGLRCRICGCFTKAKARFLHEDCPAGRWPR